MDDTKIEDQMMRTDLSAAQYVDAGRRIQKQVRLMHASMGLVTESAEFMDRLKKHIFYGEDIDYTNLQEELGDKMWYTFLALNDVDRMTLEEICALVVKKLQRRYPEKFDPAKATVRDLEAERKVLENAG